MTNSLLEIMYPLNLLGMNNNLPPQYQKVFEVYAGSVGRGVSKRGSDVDVVAIYVPDYEQLYPYKVPGFGKQPDRFTAKQVPNLSVRFLEVGNITVDVLALDVIHFFNMLLKGSPNHVEYLFFEPEAYTLTEAGETILHYRNMFLTQELITRYVAAGCSIMNRAQEQTQKEYMLATRFFAYAVQVYERFEIDPMRLKSLHLRAKEGGTEYTKTLANVFKEHAMEVEGKATYLPKSVDEEMANMVLHSVLNSHWAELAKGK